MPEEFSLLETMRLEDGQISRIERHLARMSGSARRFAFRWDEPAVRAAIAASQQIHGSGLWRLRLLLNRDGTPTVQCAAHVNEPNRRWRVAFADQPVDEHDPFLQNKTTRRDLYDRARRAQPDADDVILWNSRGEATESSIANLVVELEGQRYTPPVVCGLLPGVFRAELLDEGAIRERVLMREDVVRASRIWLINSLRGWIEAHLASNHSRRV
jgi:para-aminobenzoate synthetase / 4-amino-4-deoxychorismate lyase